MAPKATKKNAAEPKEARCTHAKCKQPAAQEGYCRLHYLANWKHIKLNNQLKAEKRLNAYVDRLAKKYPGDFMDKIREELEDENKFKQSVQELEIDPDAENPETDREFLERLSRIFKPE